MAEKTEEKVIIAEMDQTEKELFEAKRIGFQLTFELVDEILEDAEPDEVLTCLMLMTQYARNHDRDAIMEQCTDRFMKSIMKQFCFLEDGNFTKYVKKIRQTSAAGKANAGKSKNQTMDEDPEVKAWAQEIIELFPLEKRTTPDHESCKRLYNDQKIRDILPKAIKHYLDEYKGDKQYLKSAKTLMGDKDFVSQCISVYLDWEWDNEYK